MPLRNIVMIAVAAIVAIACYSVTAKARYASLFTEAMEVVLTEGLLPTDEQTLFDNAIDGMLKGFDRDTYYYRGDAFKNLQEGLNQRFDGIGMHIDTDEASQRLVVLAPIPGGPAWEAGLLPGDELIAVDGQPLNVTDRREAVERIRGPSGSFAEITINRNGEEKVIRVERRPIPVPSVQGDWLSADGSWDFRLRENPRVGYIRILQFGENTAKEFANALAAIRGRVAGLIIDVRNNPGGLLPAVVEICDQFIDAGSLIVDIRGREQKVKEKFIASSSAKVDRELPVVVLIDRRSASASEILAACLQDHGRATVVGERSFGKGTVQNLIVLQNGRSAIKLTTASYWRPSGKNIDRPSSKATNNEDWGVSPSPGHEIRTSMVDSANLYRLRHLRDLAGIHEHFGFKPRPSYSWLQTIIPEDLPPESDEIGAEVDVSTIPDQIESADQLPAESPPELNPPTDRALEHAIKLILRQRSSN